MDNPSANNSMVGTEEVIEGSHGGPYMVEKIVGIYMGKVLFIFYRNMVFV